MDIFFICVIAGLASLATFYSGFGLGTLLMPVMALFFPLEVAVALTALVHFLTNLFKLFLTYRHIEWHIVLRFGVPAFIMAFIGALVLGYAGDGGGVLVWKLLGKMFTVTWLKIMIAVLILIFVLLEWHPRLKKLSFGRDHLITGGMLSGFFGGLAGFQGALRSMFLIRFNLSKEAYIATGVCIASLIDLSRMSVYSISLSKQLLGENLHLIIFATCTAFLGAYAGNVWLKKVTIDLVQRIVAVSLVLFALALGSGLL